ncbi:MAG: ubiquinone anaerobic biosynthesis protein UbiU [Acidithiobacillus sp.]
MTRIPELVCPAGALPALKAAVDHGADAVYIGFRDDTNARNFPGLNFSPDDARKGIEYAHRAGRKVLLAINTYPQPHNWPTWTAAVDRAAALGLDAVIMADPGLLRYAASRHPDLRLHLSVQASATSHRALEFYQQRFGIRRAVLPRVLSLQQLWHTIAHSPVEIEVFGYGSLCVMVEGRCALSSYITGRSPNGSGVCSPAEAVRWEETPQGRQSRLNGVLIDRYSPGEAAGYPTLCKGRYYTEDRPYYAIEEPASLNVLDILPQLVQHGVAAIKVEGRQRSPAYVASVTRTLRAALDACAADPQRYQVRGEWAAALDHLSEGQCHTLGAYHRPWQ